MKSRVTTFIEPPSDTTLAMALQLKLYCVITVFDDATTAVDAADSLPPSIPL